MVLTAGNPLVGGTMLRRAMMQSPNFNPNTKTGWSVYQDGSAVFYTVTAEGTITANVFEGTDFVINSDGEFFYSGTPANGNLILAIANAIGTDQFLNNYKAGLEVLGTGGSAGASVWLDPVDGRIVITNAIAGYEAICDGGSLSMSTPGSMANPATYAVQDSPLASLISSPSDGVNPGAEVKLYAGTASGEPYMSTPYQVALNPATGGAETWHVPALTGGWSQATGLTAQFTLMPSGIVAVAGRIKAGTVTSGTTVMTLPAGYYPSKGTISIKVRNVSGNAVVFFSVNTAGAVQYQAGAVSGDTIDLDTMFAVSMSN